MTTSFIALVYLGMAGLHPIWDVRPIEEDSTKNPTVNTEGKFLLDAQLAEPKEHVLE